MTGKAGKCRANKTHSRTRSNHLNTPRRRQLRANCCHFMTFQCKRMQLSHLRPLGTLSHPPLQFREQFSLTILNVHKHIKMIIKRISLSFHFSHISGKVNAEILRLHYLFIMYANAFNCMAQAERDKNGTSERQIAEELQARQRQTICIF